MTEPRATRRPPVTAAMRAGGGATVALFGFSLIDAVISVAVPPMMGATLTDAIGKGVRSPLVWIVVTLLVLGVVVESVVQISDFRSRYRGVRRLRNDTLAHVLRLGYRGQRRFSQGDLVNRLIDSTDRTSRVAKSTSGVMIGLVSSIGGLVGLFLIDVPVGLTFLICVPLIVVMTMRQLGSIVSLSGAAAEAQGEIATRMMDSIRGLRTIRASGTVELEITRALSSIGLLRRVSLDIWESQRALVWRTTIIAPMLVITVLAVGGYRLTVGRLDSGALLAIAAYVVMAIGALQVLGSAKDIADTFAASARLAELLDEPALAPGTRELPAGGGSLRFVGVGSRVGDRQVLRDVTFEVPAGRTVALVGESGVGKSTVTALAGGILVPDGGQVTFDGTPIDQVRSDQLRAVVVYAFERPALLGETIGDALRYGDDTVTDAAVHAALRSTDADGFVGRLPRRLDTPIEDLRLSGGELQRLGLARAACRQVRLFIMDDALSSVDTSTEAAISAALQHVSLGVTRLLVAHRASTAARADRVVWLRDGSVAGIGSHRELLADAGYRAVFAISDEGRSNDPVPPGAGRGHGH